jgi:hypothetical protein
MDNGQPPTVWHLARITFAPVDSRESADMTLWTDTRVHHDTAQCRADVDAAIRGLIDAEFERFQVIPLGSRRELWFKRPAPWTQDPGDD